MRLVQVAKALGMTGQQLRKELTEVDFGMKPTDREVPDSLAQGIVRFVARKHGIEVDMEALGFSAEEEKEDASDSAEEESAAEDAEDASIEEKPAVEGVARKNEPKKQESLNVLRKLSLDDVSKEAIAKQTAELQHDKKPTKEEREEIEREEKLMAQTKKRASEGVQEQIKKKDGVVLLPGDVTVKEFAEKTGVQVPAVIQTLMKNGVMATVNQTIDFDTAALVADELGVKVQKQEVSANVETLLAGNLEDLIRDEPEHLLSRPPVVVVMGHVDHGKTAILDAIRETDVVSGEAGGITQHIGAYQVDFVPSGSSEKQSITFLDTPGHEAFTAMRARGAHVTDIAIIVVSAEEGVKPTTVEAIHHAKEAEVPILVAINKIDKENANPEKVMGELAANDLQPEEWGGKTPVVLCSAVTKQGIPELLEHVLLLAELAELKANPNRRAIATVIESHLDSSHGPLATVIVNTGTLVMGDIFICGTTTGRIRAMMDAHGKRLQSVPPSGPVRISGFSGVVPNVGDILQVVSSEKQARDMVDQMKEHHHRGQKRSFADLVSRLSEGKLTQLKVILKADTQGSLEAIRSALSKLATEEVAVKVIHSGVGDVTESDVMMAAASEGMVVAFQTGVDSDVVRTADREGVQVREYDVVYTLLDELEGLTKGLIEPDEEEKILGHLEVKQVFLTKKSEQIVGGKVTDGVIKRLPFRLFRDEQEVGTGRITSLKHVERDIKEAKEGTECGMRVETSLLIQEGDTLEVFLKELKKKR
ncbi:translation initiation factor IF-2 [Candidatus Peregrinibacteria bacterium CG10_big_fil_rev_8_21_14_0_10_49_10]|nr:MAG: translation initiation factor IF-2 [Candidatus Peregrinibacteria bacterium CG10_big_fil_rev_8_21_14_0_10_49_10]